VTVAHGVPSTNELAEAVRGFLREDVMPATEGRLNFMSRVAANVVAIIERELELGPQVAAAHAARLRQLGAGDDAELCAAIRAGRFDDRAGELVAAVRASVVDKLRIANPRYLVPGDAPDHDLTSQTGDRKR
jgi:hypothetical protein